MVSLAVLGTAKALFWGMFFFTVVRKALEQRKAPARGRDAGA